MDTLPSDLLFLLDPLLSPHQSRLLGLVEDQKNLDLKWFYYNLSVGGKCGYELIQMANRGEFTFLKSRDLIKIADIRCANLIVESILVALINRNEDLLLKNIINQKHLFGVYFSYMDLNRTKTISALHKKENIVGASFQRNYRIRTILATFDRVQHDSIEIQYDTLKILLEAVIFHDHDTFYKQYQNIPKYDNNLKDFLLMMSVKVQNLTTFEYIYNKERNNPINSYWFHQLETSLINDIIEYDAHAILELYYDLSNITIPTWLNNMFYYGYQGPMWNKLLQLYPDAVHEIDIFGIFEADILYKISLEQLKTVFELSKPSRRELIKFYKEISKTKRYDIWVYVCELLASF